MIRHPRIWAAAAAAAGAFISAGQARAGDTASYPPSPPATATPTAPTPAEPPAPAVQKSTTTSTTSTVVTPPEQMTPAAGETVAPTDAQYQANAERDLLMPPEPSGKGKEERHLVTPFGMALSLGGGITDFTAEQARISTDIGGSYGARLTLGTRTPFALEVAYVGSAQNIDVLGLDTSAILLGNGGEADLRLNFATKYVEPYIFGGAGFTHYSIENEDFNTSAVANSDDIYTIPMGGGVAMQYKGLIVDGRGTFRYAFNEDLLGQDQKLHTWGANVNVGFEF